MKHFQIPKVAVIRIFYLLLLYNILPYGRCEQTTAELGNGEQIFSRSSINEQGPPVISMRGNAPINVLERLYEDLFPDDIAARRRTNYPDQTSSAYYSPAAASSQHHHHSLMLGGADGMMLLRNYEDAAIAYLQQLKQCRNDVCGQLPLIVPGLSAENDLFCGSDGYLHTRCTQSCMNSKVHLARRFTRNRHYKYSQNRLHPNFLPALQNHSYVVLQEMVLPNSAVSKQLHHVQHNNKSGSKTAPEDKNTSALSAMASASVLAAHKLPVANQQHRFNGAIAAAPSSVTNSFQQLCPPAHEPRFDRLFGRWRNHCNKVCAGQFLEDDLVVGWTGAEHIVFGCHRALSCFNKRALALLGVGTFANLLQRSYDSVHTEKATIEAVEFYPYLGVDCYRNKCLSGGGTSARRRRTAAATTQQSTPSSTAIAIELDAVLMSSTASGNDDTYCGSDGLLYHDLCAVGCKNAALYNIKSSLAHVVVDDTPVTANTRQQSSSYTKTASTGIVPIALRDANFVLAHPYKADEGCFGEPWYPWKDVQAEFDLWKHNAQALCKDFPGSTICGVNRFDSMMFPCEAAMTDFNKNIERQLHFTDYNYPFRDNGETSSRAMSLLSSLRGVGAETVFRDNNADDNNNASSNFGEVYQQQQQRSTSRGDKFEYFPTVRACDITDAFLMSYMIAHKALTQQNNS